MKVRRIVVMAIVMKEVDREELKLIEWFEEKSNKSTRLRKRRWVEKDEGEEGPGVLEC
jgi:hypothetical protein